MRPALLPLVALAACGSDSSFTASPRCDGVKQKDEKYVDAPFDADGDGYFDSSIPDCKETYAAEDLDCDDRDAEIHPGAEELCDGIDNDCNEGTDENFGADAVTWYADLDGDGYGNLEAAVTLCSQPPEHVLDGTDCNDNNGDIHPGADEICGDGIDQNCDGEADESCSADYSGLYNLDSYPSYSCAFGLVAVSFGQIYIVDTYPTISVSGQGGGSQPGTMTGSFTSASDFSAQRVIAGGCTETYTATGTFTGENTFTATVTAQFSGSYCYDCTMQSWTVNGVR